MMKSIYQIICWFVIVFIIATFSNASDFNAKEIKIGQRIKADYDTTVTDWNFIIKIKHKESKSINGQLLLIDSDSIVVREEWKDSTIKVILVSKLKNIYLPNGKRHATQEGVFGGFLLGLLLTDMAVRGDPIDPNNRGWAMENPGEAALAFMGGGMLIGGIIGSLFTATRWKKVDKKEWPIELKVTNSANRLDVGLTFNF